MPTMPSVSPSAQKGFRVAILVHCLVPEGLDLTKLAATPADCTWTEDKWVYCFEVILDTLDFPRIVEEIARWNQLLLAAGYDYHQFGVTCELLP